MLNRMEFSRRFFSCYPDLSRGSMARLFKVSQPTVSEWAREGNVPWSKLKYLSDSQAVSWDWILEGVKPKNSSKAAKQPRFTSPKFNRTGINHRFLSLFPNMTLTQLAAILGVTSGAVSGWNRGFSQVSWERLYYAVTTFGVRWDWLIDGLEPKYRKQQE